MTQQGEPLHSSSTGPNGYSASPGVLALSEGAVVAPAPPTGQTIGAFGRELRLRHALALILDGARSLAEVALATGFASQAHLTAQFRARFGVTPRRACVAGGLARAGL